MRIFEKGDAHTGPSFSFKNRFARASWNFCWLVFFRLSPVPFHRWRSMLLRMWGAKVGRNCHIYPHAIIWAPWNLICGDEVGVANDATLYNQATIRLGYRCVISQGVYLCTGTHDYTSPAFELISRPIEIGHSAWIASRAFVHPGVTIGEGVVVGACSVVIQDLPAWTVCTGNPCLPIKPRVLKLNEK